MAEIPAKLTLHPLNPTLSWRKNPASKRSARQARRPLGANPREVHYAPETAATACSLFDGTRNHLGTVPDWLCLALKHIYETLMGS